MRPKIELLFASAIVSVVLGQALLGLASTSRIVNGVSTPTPTVTPISSPLSGEQVRSLISPKDDGSRLCSLVSSDNYYVSGKFVVDPVHNISVKVCRPKIKLNNHKAE